MSGLRRFASRRLCVSQRAWRSLPARPGCHFSAAAGAPREPAADTDPVTGRRTDGTLDRAFYDPPTFRPGVEGLEPNTKYTEHLNFPPEIMAQQSEDNQFAPDEPSLLQQWGNVLPLAGFGSVILVSKELLFIEPEVGASLLSLGCLSFVYLAFSDNVHEGSARYYQKLLEERVDAIKGSQASLRQCLDLYKREVAAGETYRSFADFQNRVFEKAASYYAWKFQHDVTVDVLARLHALQRAEEEKQAAFEQGRVERAVDTSLEAFSKDPKLQASYLKSYVDYALGKSKSFADPLEAHAKGVMTAENEQMKANVDKEFPFSDAEIETLTGDIRDLQNSESLGWIGAVTPSKSYVPRLTGMAGPVAAAQAAPLSGAKALDAIRAEAGKAEQSRYQ